MEFYRRSEIFRKSRLVAADLLQCSPPDQCIGAKQGTRVPRIHADADRAKKLICGFGCSAANEASFPIREGLHNLHEPNTRISEMAEGALQKLGFRRVIRVENDDDFAIGLFESVIDITGLGMFVIRACDISGPKCFCC